MKRYLYIFLSLLTVISFSCKKSVSPGDCFKSTGELTKEEREIQSYGNVILKDNVSLYLTNGTSNRITVEAGKNLLKKIKTEVNENGDLVISNENRCNWVRNYASPVNVYLECKSFDTLFYASIGDVKNVKAVDTLYFGDSFCIQISEGAGNFNLNIKTSYLLIVFLYGTCDVNITGFAKTVSAYSTAWGRIDFSGVHCERAWALNQSSNDMYLYASEKLSATTRALGNIYISGNPASVEFSREGDGDLIRIP